MSKEPIVLTFPEPPQFTVRGQTFSLPVLDTLFRLEEIAEECKKAELDQREYLTRVQQYFREQTGVELSLGESDWLASELDAIQMQRKQDHREKMKALGGA